MKLRIEQEREKNDWTVAYIANEIGITKSAISQILNGKFKPSYDILCKLEDLFKLNHRKLFDVVDDDGN